MGKVELTWAQLRSWNISLVDLAERYTESRVVLRRTAVVEVLSPAGDGNRGQREDAGNSLHLDDWKVLRLKPTCSERCLKLDGQAMIYNS